MAAGVAEVVDRAVDDRRVRTAVGLAAGAILYWGLLRRLYHPPAGIYLQGIVLGGLNALLAFGLALVYRANRIINFAQGDLGSVPASLAVLLMLGNGLPYLAAFPLTLVAGIALGALVEFVFIRRFFKAPRLILTVVTIGVSQILTIFPVAMPRWFGVQTTQNRYDPPFGGSFDVGGTTFGGNEVIALAVVPVVIVALAAFFRYTNIGIAVRASAESSDRAALLGVPVKRIETIVWVIAAVLASVAVFLRGGIYGLPIGSALGPTVLVRALAAGIIGRMERLPTILAASLAIGVLEAVMNYRDDGLLIAPVLFLVILTALLLQRRGTSRVDDDRTSSWQAARDVRPIPRELRRLPEVVWGVRGGLALLAAFLVLVPATLNAGDVNIAAVVLIWTMIALSLTVLTGWAGQVSLGQIAFFAVGAVVAGHVTVDRQWDISLALLCGGLAGAVVAVFIGLPALRIRGLFLAVVTLAASLSIAGTILTPQYLKWVPDQNERISRTALFGRVDVESELRFYYLTLAALVLVVVAVRGLRRSRTGRVLIGVRENPRGAQAYGVNVTTAKLTAFAVSGFIAAFAGALFIHHQGSMGLSFYSYEQSRRAFTMVVIGGLSSVPGAFLGAFFIQGIDYFRTAFPEVVRPYLEFLTSGIGLILVLLLLPGGFSQVFYGARDRLLRVVAERRSVLVPSLVADRRAEGVPPGVDDGAPLLPPEATEDELAAALEHATGELPAIDPLDDGSVGAASATAATTATRPRTTRKTR